MEKRLNECVAEEKESERVLLPLSDYEKDCGKKSKQAENRERT
jgi:hypothetical protein